MSLYVEEVLTGFQKGVYNSSNPAYIPLTQKSEDIMKITTNAEIHSTPGSTGPYTGATYSGIKHSSFTLPGEFRDFTLLSHLIGKREATTGDDAVDFTDKIFPPEVGDAKPDSQLTIIKKYVLDSGAAEYYYYDKTRISSCVIGGVLGETIKQTVGGITGKKTTSVPITFQHYAPDALPHFDYDNTQVWALMDGEEQVPFQLSTLNWQIAYSIEALKTDHETTGDVPDDLWPAGFSGGRLNTQLGFSWYADQNTSASFLFDQLVNESASVDIGIYLKRWIDPLEKLYNYVYFKLDDAKINGDQSMAEPILGKRFMAYSANLIIPSPDQFINSDIGSDLYV